MVNDKSITVRPHFLYVFTLLYPYLTLLIIPVIRGAIHYLTDRRGVLSAFFTAEVMMLFIAVVAAVLKLKRTKVTVGESIKVEKGLFFRVSYTIPRSCARVILLEQNPFLRPFGVYRLKIYTEAGIRRRPDENLPIGRRSAKALFEKYAVNGATVKSNTLGNVLLSAALSSSMAGLLLAAPAVRLVASLLGEGVSALLPRLRSADIGIGWIDSLGKSLPIIIFAGYVVSFTVILLRNVGFMSARSEDRIMLDSGKLPHRTAFLSTASVTVVKTVTAPLMFLAGKCAVKFSACGFGRNKGEVGLLVPCVKRTMAQGLVRWLLPGFKPCNVGTAPDHKALSRCLFLPSVCALITVISTNVAGRLVPELLTVVQTFATVCFALIVMWSAARIVAIFKGYFSLDDQSLCIKYRYGFGMAELQTSTENIEYIRLSQTPFDRPHGHCTVKVATNNKNRDIAKLRYLDYLKVKRLVEDFAESTRNR